MYFVFIFQISGIAILVVGALIQDYFNYPNVIGGNFNIGPVLLIILGVIVFVVAFFGCCGAVKENHCMIMTVSWLAFVYFLYLDNIFYFFIK
jgi:CD63 antigen